ncbi:MAG: 3-deoxy-D-manno-octulosonic acid transferase [Bauldia sp.]|nr:3-deoxy-D-manno-octulosonic acid transferase [Bauldia sp.]
MPEGLGGAMLSAYGAAGTLLRPVLPLVLRLRAQRGREDPGRLGERKGIASAPRPPGDLLWVHAASVGETNAVMPLVHRLAEAGWAIVFTTVTVTGATTAARSLPPGAIHQFVPVDVRPWVRRFLAHWRPAAALFVESEIWPVTTGELARLQVPHVIVNGRMSERAYRSWLRYGKAAHGVFGRIGPVLAQSAADGERMTALGAPNVAVLGNLKFDAPPPPADAAALATLSAQLGRRPRWLAASTHPGEEGIVADAHRRLLERHPTLVTMVVPRHPERGAAIVDALGKGNASVWLRSRGGALGPGPGILVGDTLGELGLFYRLAPVSFVGGSIAPRGGQNPIEPVRLRSAILHGPETANFAEIYAALGRAGGAVETPDAATMASVVARLLGDEATRLRQLVAAETALEPFSGALRRTLDALAPILAAARERGGA